MNESCLLAWYPLLLPPCLLSLPCFTQPPLNVFLRFILPLRLPAYVYIPAQVLEAGSFGKQGIVGTYVCMCACGGVCESGTMQLNSTVRRKKKKRYVWLQVTGGVAGADGTVAATRLLRLAVQAAGAVVVCCACGAHQSDTLLREVFTKLPFLSSSASASVGRLSVQVSPSSWPPPSPRMHALLPAVCRPFFLSHKHTTPDGFNNTARHDTTGYFGPFPASWSKPRARPVNLTWSGVPMATGPAKHRIVTAVASVVKADAA